MFKSRKGITPVIAIVLLLLITVGAVGVVYTQFQSLIGNPGEQASQQQDIQNTEVSFDSLYRSDWYGTNDYVNVTFSNTGSVTWNSSNFGLQYVPEGTGSGVSGEALATTNFNYESDADTCFNDESGGGTLVDPGDSYTCSTGVQWPNPTNSIGFVVTISGADKDWGPRICNPDTSSSVGC